MTTKDYIEILYWFTSLGVLIATVYWIAISPIKAVEIGRKLDNEQNKYNAKRELFLILFSLRGNPAHYDFVNGLNQIDIVFQDDEKVLAAWGKLYESMDISGLTNPNQTWELLRTELLSEMAESLGYKKLKQTSIQRNYSPLEHANRENENWNYHLARRNFYETGAEMHTLWIQHFMNADNSEDNSNNN